MQQLDIPRVRLDMRITSLQPHARDPRRVHLHIDGCYRLTVAVELVASLPLREGDEVTEEQLLEMAGADQRWRAREAALTLLSFRTRTEAELRRRLAEKGFPDEVVCGCVRELVDRGLVSDTSFAESFLRDRLRFRPRGPQLLLHELRTRGVDVDVAKATLEEVMAREAVSETEMARQAASKWVPRRGDMPLRSRRRLYSFLMRRGFSPDAIREVVDEIVP
jgi:regulatory protein